MKITTLDGKEHEFKFGIGFVRAIDKVYTVEKEGFKFGVGLDLTLTKLISRDPVTLAEYLYNARKDSTLTREAIENLLDSLPNKEYEALYDAVIDEISKANATASKYKAVKANLQAAQKKNKK